MGLTAEDHADILCVLATSYVLGVQSDQSIADEEKQGLASVMTYFIGKLRGRHPALKMTELLAPDYVQSLQGEIAAAAERCSEEAVDMGNDLQKAGRILIESDALISQTF